MLRRLSWFIFERVSASLPFRCTLMRWVGAGGSVRLIGWLDDRPRARSISILRSLVSDAKASKDAYMDLVISLLLSPSQ